MKLRMRIEGERELRRKLDRLAKGPRQAAVEQALRAGAEIIAERARANVAVRSGQLRDSIDVGTNLKHFGPVFADGMVGLGSGRVEGRGVAVYVGPTAPDGFYGHMVEFGTINAPAHPFMRPAFETSRAAAQQAIVAELRRAIDDLGKS